MTVEASKEGWATVELKVRISVKVAFEKVAETRPSALGGVGVVQLPLVSELSGAVQEVHWFGEGPAQVAQVVEQGRHKPPLTKNPLEVLQAPQVLLLRRYFVEGHPVQFVARLPLQEEHVGSHGMQVPVA